MRRARLRFGSLLGVLAAACGSSRVSDPGTKETFPDPIVTISASGLTPGQVHMNLTQPVQFVNRDSAAHTIVSAPELGFGECADAARVGRIEAAQSKTVMLQHEGICAMRDSDHPANPSYQVLFVAH